MVTMSVMTPFKHHPQEGKDFEPRVKSNTVSFFLFAFSLGSIEVSTVVLRGKIIDTKGVLSCSSVL